MAKLILDINDNDLSVRAEGSITTDNILLRGSISFSAGWEKYAKTVVFYQNPRKTYRVIVSGEEIDVPSEAVKVGGHLFVGVYGIYTEDGTVYRKVTNIASVPVTAGAYDEANTPEPPTVTEYEQMISIMQAYMDAAEVTGRAERAAAQIDAKESEANSYADEAKTAANAAKKDAEGASASALSAAGSASASSVSQKAAETAKAAAESNAASASASAQNAKTYSEAAEASAKSAADTVAVSDISQLANALKGEKRGEGLSLGEVSPVPHKVKFTARSKNLLPYPYIKATTTINGITFTSNGDGSIIANGTATGAALFWVQNLQLKEGVPYVLSSGVNSPLNTCSIRSLDAVSVFATTSTTPVQFIPQKTDTYLVCARINPGETVNNLTFYPQLEEGETATEWSPYVDITAVKSRNLIPYPYAETSKTVSGMTYTVNADGSIKLNGTATAQSSLTLWEPDNFVLGVGDSIFVSGMYVTAKCEKSDGSTIFVPGGLVSSNSIKKILKIYIDVAAGLSLSNYTTYPMLNYGGTALPFEKYFEPRPLNLKSCGKNLLPYPYYEKTKTVNGITFTDNGDGSITANGTATGTAAFQLVRGFSIKAGQYTLSGCPVGGNKDTKFGLNFNDFEFATGGTPSFNAVWDVGNGNTAVISKDVKIFADIIIRTGYVANNLTFYPQIELGDTATEYEQYKAGETVAVADASGQAELASVAPNMTVLADREGVLLGCEYNEDANKVIKKLIAAVKELGGNI